MANNQAPVMFDPINAAVEVNDEISDEELSDETDFDDQESVVSDCESGIAGERSKAVGFFVEGFVKLDEMDRGYTLLERRFIAGLGPVGTNTRVLAVHRNDYGSSFVKTARLQTFQLFANAMQKMRDGGPPNLKYAWYGASKDELRRILSYGFGHSDDKSGGVYGSSITLSADSSPLESVKYSDADEDGIQYVLLCRVLLGRTEQVYPGSRQSCPSSEHFDSGVDNLHSPKKYIVWNTNINTHILPDFVISFKAPNFYPGPPMRDPIRKPTSPYMMFPTLIAALSKVLPPQAISMIMKSHRDLRERKITRRELITQIRLLAGDRLLTKVITSSRYKRGNSGF